MANFTFILKYGPMPAILVVWVLGWFGAKYVAEKLKEHKERFDKSDKGVERLDRRIDTLADDADNYVEKERYYQDVSGWRGETRALAGKIDRLTEELSFLKGRCHECVPDR